MRSKKFAALVYFIIIGAATLLLTDCSGDEFEASSGPGGGLIVINETQSNPFFINWVTWNTIGNTTTISLSGNYFNPSSLAFETPLLVLILPSNTTLFAIDLENSGSSFTDANFISSAVSGEATLDSITPSQISGSLDASFEDANGEIRELTNVHFLVP